MSVIRIRVFLSVLLMILFLTGCTSKETAVPSDSVKNSSTNSVSTDSVSTKSAAANSITSEKTFTYKIMDETYTEEDINAKYPQLINANDNKKSDSINKAIQNDIRAYLNNLKTNTLEMGKLTLDLKYEITGYKNKVLSIEYKGVSSTKDTAYPVNVYHTCNIDLISTDFVSLKDLFNIDGFFAEQFISGMYSPYTDDLDLEASGVDLKETISGQYSKKALIDLFSADTVNYRLTDQGVIISVEVPHVLGDHLEMAINYESIERNIVKNNPVWKDYLFIAEPDVGSADNTFKCKAYSNPRFGYQLSYPDIFTKSSASDNGDGISLQSGNGSATLKIWGSYNINDSTGKTLLEESKTRVSHILSESNDDQFYTIVYEGGGDGQPILFHECGFISGGTIISYVISYPEEEKDKYSSAISRMTEELKAIKISQ